MGEKKSQQSQSFQKALQGKS